MFRSPLPGDHSAFYEEVKQMWGRGRATDRGNRGKGHEKPHQPDVTDVGQECRLLITLLDILKSSGV